MRYKLILGWLVLLGVAFSPVLLWFLLGDGAEGFTDYSSITQSIGELTALVAITMFSLTFILSTRISFIEDVFGGLDKVYIAHGVLGGLSLICILLHPIFLVLKFVPSDMRQAALYLLPSSYWSVNFGIIALLGMIFLIYLTLFTKIRYNTWKFTHEFLGLVFIFAVLHTFLVRGNASRDNIFTGYYIFAAVVSLIGLGGFAYSLFIKNRLFKAAAYKVTKIKQKGASTYEIFMAPEHKPLRYKSGQFIFVRFYNAKLSREAHPFSIASKSDNVELKIIVKSLGDFTSQIAHLRVGDKVSIEGPYGRFNYNRDGGKHQIWLAGGIGITPFMGMAEDILDNHNLKNRVDLYYSVKNTSDFVGLDELNDVASKNPKFRVFPWVTGNRGYLTINDISHMSGGLQGKEFYLCGPEMFKKSIINSLIKFGISKEHIHTEEFEFR